MTTMQLFKMRPKFAVWVTICLDQIGLKLIVYECWNFSMKIRNWTHVVAWTVGWTTLLIGPAIPLTKMFEPEERLIDIAIQSALIGGLLCLPVFGFICYQSLALYRTREALADLLNRDRLTNVATRDYFYTKLARNPDGYGVSLMVDIDHFKQINDTYGHLAGDAVIARVAHLIDSQTRQNDIVCRFGGEEFVVFLTQANLVEGQVIAERIRQAIAQYKVNCDMHILSVTVSIGGALVETVRGIDTAIRAADVALYRAKKGGRNRVAWENALDAQLQEPGLRDAS